MAPVLDAKLTGVQAVPLSEYAIFSLLAASQITKIRPGCENAWPDVLSIAIISLSLPIEVEVMPLVTVPRFCQLDPLSLERAVTIEAPEALALCEMSM